MTEEVSTFAQAIRRYFERYPQSRPKQAVEVVCKQLQLTPDERMKGYARVLKNRQKAAVTVRKSACSAGVEGVVTDGVVGVHRVTFGPVEVPGWVAAGIVDAAGHVEVHGWKWAGHGKLRNRMAQCLIPGTGFRQVFYAGTGRLMVYAGDGEPDMKKREALRLAVFGNLATVVQPVVCASSDPVNLAENLKKVNRELGVFVESVLLADDSKGFHMTWFRDDFKNVGPFKVVFKDRRVTARKDGSHPSCIEFEISPTGVADVRQRLVRLEGSLEKAVGEAVEKSVSEGVAQGVGDAMQSFSEKFSASFSEKFSAEFATKMKELFGVREQESTRHNAAAADGRRYS